MEKITRFKETLKILNNLIGEIELCNVKEEGEQQQQPLDKHDLELGELPYRVIHLNDNLYNRVIQEEQAQYEALKCENERLRARLSLIESGNDADVTRRIDDAVNNAHQIEMLTQKVTEFKNREDKIMSSLRKTASEFREACFSLIGYRVDALKDNIYRLSHRYANRDDEKLFFEVKRDGTIVLLKNDYSNRYSQFVSTYLENGDSYPAFLAALTLDMFKSSNAMDSTQAMDMSMSMSTTILPNPRCGAK